MLSLEGLSVGAGGSSLLQGIELELAAGEFVALIGPSGCGKTTLLRAVAGLTDLLDGRILYQGREPDDLGWPHYRRRVVLVDQRPVLFDQTVRFNLEKPFTYSASKVTGLPEEPARELLRVFGIAETRMEQEARSLSEGEQQRVCLVRALLVDPEVLLLDEPTSALDPESVAMVEEMLVREAKRRGLAALIVTHDRHQADRLCDRVVDLRRYLVTAAATTPGGLR